MLSVIDQYDDCVKVNEIYIPQTWKPRILLGVGAR
jgi:hypothetical protein